MVTQVTSANFSTATVTAFTTPTVSSITVTDNTYVATGATAVALSGGYVKIIGNNFVSGATVYIDSTPATSVTFVSSTQLNAQVPSLVSNTYVVYIINPDGSIAIRVNGINYSSTPTWVSSVAQNVIGGTVNLQLVASSDTTVTYSLAAGSSLPSGVTLSSSGLLSGTTTGSGITVYNFSIVATDLETQVTTQAFAVTISFYDPYFNYTTMLLNGETTNTPFKKDSSTNNFDLTVVGDTKPLPFTPYQDGYYSTYFDSSNYFTTSYTSNLGLTTGDFTIELWLMMLGTENPGRVINVWNSSTSSSAPWQILVASGSNIFFTASPDGSTTPVNLGGGGYTTNVWYHVAGVRSGNVFTLYVNGVSAGTTTQAITLQTGNTFTVGARNSAGSYVEKFNGHVSNIRIVKGTALYTSAFTPPIAPLTASIGTQFLTCQSNRFIDKSVNVASFTFSGTPKISSANPFGAQTSVTVNTGYSVYFDGSSNFYVPASSTLSATGDVTIEFWAYQIARSGTQYVYDNWVNGTLGAGNLELGILTAGTVRWYYDGSTNLTTNGIITTGGWVHIAYVRSGSTLKIYVNGVVDSNTATFAGTIGRSDTNAYVGSDRPTSTNFFNGYISNFRFVKSAVYTTNFTPSTIPLTAITNTSLLTCQADLIIKDNSTNAFTITQTGSPKVLNNAYPFTQPTVTISNLSTLGSTYFDGTGDYLNTPSNTALKLSSSNFTIEAWLYFNTTASGQQPISDAYGATDWSWAFYTTASGTLNYYLSSSGSSSWNIANGPLIGNIVANTWYHVALVRNGSVFTPYLNGVSGTTTTNASALFSSPTGVYIGGPAGVYFTGYISDLRIVKGTAVYTSAFTPPTTPLTAIANTSLLTLQYNGGANNYGIIDNSPFNNIITRAGNSTQGSFSPYSQTGFSNYFSASDYFQLPTSTTAFQFLTNNFTIEGWVYLNSAVTAANRMIWYNYISSFTTDSIFFGGHASFNGQITFWVYNLNAGAAPILTDPTVLTPFVWTHLAVVRNGNNFTLYRNGVSVSTATFSGSTVGNTWVYGGYIGTGAGSLNGYLSNFRIVNGTAVYTANFTPPTTPLTPITGTALLICQSNRFVDNSPNNLALAVNGTPSVQALSPFGSISEATPLTYSVYTGSNSDYLSIASTSAFNLASNNFTIEGWVYLTGAQGASGQGGLILGKWTAGSSAGADWFFGILNPSTLYFSCNTTGGISVSSPTPISYYTWTHVAIVRNSNNFILYQDGASVGTSVFSGAIQYTSSTAVRTSVWDSGTSYFLGYMSNVRLVNGSAVYTQIFTPPSSPLTNITNTTLLICQSATIKDNSSTNFTITQGGSPKVSKYNPLGFTSQSVVSYNPTLHGGSVYFDGTSDKLTIANYPGLALSTNDFTLQAWFYTTAASINQVVMTNGWAAYAPWLIQINTSNQLLLNISTNGGSWAVSDQLLATITTGQWYHVAITRASGTLRAFVNGVQTYTVSLATALYNGSQALTVGGRSDTSAVFNGYITDTQIINGTALYINNFLPPTTPITATSQTTFLCNFTNGGIVDAHSSNNHETVNNVQLSTSVKKYGNSSISFNGTNQQLTSYQVQNVQFGSGNWTVEFWAYFNSLAGAQVFANYGYDTSTTRSWILYINVGVMRIAQSTDGSANVDASLGTPSLTTGAWNHFAFVRNGSVITLYVNGVSTGTTATAYTLAALSTTYYFKIGGDTTNFFNGYMDDFRITKGVARYTANFTAPTTALIAF